MASDNRTIFKIIVFFGLLFVLVGSLSQDVTAWNNLNSAISGFPTYVNAFSPRNFTMLVASEGSNTGPPRGAGSNDASVSNCNVAFTNSGNTTFGCVQQKNEGGSYVQILGLAPTDRFSENLTGFPGGGGQFRIVSMTIYIECSSEDNSTALGVEFVGTSLHVNPGGNSPSDAIQWFPEKLICPSPIGTYANITTTADLTLGGYDPISIHEMAITYDSFAKAARISEMHIQISYQHSLLCSFQASGNPWDDISRATYYLGCVFSAIGNFFSDLGSAGLNILIFFGAIILWWIGVMLAFTALLFAFTKLMASWPPLISNIVTVLFSGLIIYFGMVIFGKIRGANG